MRDIASKPRKGITKATAKPRMSTNLARTTTHDIAKPVPDTREALDRKAMARLQAAAAMSDDQINLDDPEAPLVTDWSGAVRGKFFKPVKRLKSFRIDADVLAYFEAKGKGYQATINRVLREAMMRDLRNPDAGPVSARHRAKRV